MNERIMQFRVGVMILATILIAAILGLLFMGTGPLLRGTYPIYIKFNDAPGVTRDTPGPHGRHPHRTRAKRAACQRRRRSDRHGRYR